ncbi:MAG: MMPL family transporter [Flavobacteriales bacterium]|nr:MMPL family transporter [Flavobacteriales bacterium]
MNRKLGIGLLSLVAIITAVSVYLTSQLKFDYDFEKFFPKNHPETEFYEKFRNTFETDNDFVIVSLVNNDGIFRQEFLEQVDSLARAMTEIENMLDVISPTDLKEFIRDPFMGTVFAKPLLRIDEPENYSVDSVRIWQSANFIGTFFSRDGKAVAINMKHNQGLSKKACDKISLDVEEALRHFSFDEEHVIGRCLGQRIYVDMMVDELVSFVLISICLTIIFLLVAFRSFWNMLIPVLVVIFSILWTLGIMKLIGKDIDIMLTVLPTIIFIVGMSDSVHILSGYLDELRGGKQKREAIVLAMRKAGLATFLTAFTSAIGFATLIFNRITPISDFGVYTSIGVMLAFVLTYLMLPATLILVPVPRLVKGGIEKDFWSRKLHVGFRLLLRYRRKVMWISLALAGIGVWGITLLHSNNFILEDLEDGHRLKNEFHFLENKFSGARPFEMAVELKAGVRPLDPKVLHELEEIENHLRNDYGVGILLSPVKLMKEAFRTWNGGSEEFHRLPQSEEEIRTVENLLKRKEFRDVFSLVVNEDKHWMRISGKVGDLGRTHYENKNENLALFVAQNTTKNLFDYRLTGTAVLIDLNNTYLTENMLWGLLTSVLIIGVCMAFLFGSFRIGLISLLPNLLPLALVAGIMGFAGINLKISTSIIFGIAFGIAVDDTIHFLAKLKLQLREGRTLPYAIKRTFLTTGKAMVVTSLILCAGFVMLIFSSFMGTFYIGLLIGLTLIIAMVAELTLAPILLLWLYRPRKKK